MKNFNVIHDRFSFFFVSEWPLIYISGHMNIAHDHHLYGGNCQFTGIPNGYRSIRDQCFRLDLNLVNKFNAIDYCLKKKTSNRPLLHSL